MFSTSEASLLSATTDSSLSDPASLYSQIPILSANFSTELSDPASSNFQLSRSSLSLNYNVSTDTDSVFGEISFPLNPLFFSDVQFSIEGQPIFDEKYGNAIALVNHQSIEAHEYAASGNYLNPMLNLGISAVSNGAQLNPEIETVSEIETVYIPADIEALPQTMIDITSFAFSVGSDSANINF